MSHLCYLCLHGVMGLGWSRCSCWLSSWELLAEEQKRVQQWSSLWSSNSSSWAIVPVITLGGLRALGEWHSMICASSICSHPQLTLADVHVCTVKGSKKVQKESIRAKWITHKLSWSGQEVRTCGSTAFIVLHHGHLGYEVSLHELWLKEDSKHLKTSIWHRSDITM